MRILFILIVSLLFGLVLWGFLSYQSIDTYTRDKVLNGYMVGAIIGSLVIGLLLFWLFTRAFPKGWINQNKLGRILMPVVFVIMSFVFIRNLIIFINIKFGHQEAVIIRGVISEKQIKKGRRWRKKTYFVIIKDLQLGSIYRFNLREEAFYSLDNIGDNFVEEYQLGSLGILYRK